MALLRLIFKTLRLSILRVGAGWMFALLTFNFNRVSIADLGAIAVIVTTLIGLHHFISFFQVYWGRIADRTPIFGYRRTPYIILSSLAASTVFLFLPSIAIGLGERSFLATGEAFLLVGLFGICMAMNGSSSNALIAEVTTPKQRGAVIAFVWASVIISGIASSIVAGAIMPTYTPEAMQQLYNLTPIVVLVSLALGVLGMERRLTRDEVAAIKAAKATEEDVTPLGTFRVARRLLADTPIVRAFFLFVLLAIMGIFLQDAILEPFGAEVFGLNQKETAAFQQSWGVGALGGMLLIGIVSSLFPISKKLIATIGGLGVAAGLSTIALAGLTHQVGMISPGLMVMGLGIGFFNVGALSLMMEMTIEGQAGLYMGLWGMAQGLGNGFANVLSGAFHTAMIETGILTPTLGYSSLFFIEALLMVTAVGILRGITVQEFKGLSREDVSTVLAMDTR